MRLYSKNRMIEIKMRTWEGTGFSPDWSADFFDGAAYNDALDAYEVDDIDYCIDQAMDCKNGVGDFQNEDQNEEAMKEIDVDVTELDFPPITQDGHYICEGDWISDKTGTTYEVQDISDRVYLKEIVWEDDENYHFGDHRILNRSEISRMEFE